MNSNAKFTKYFGGSSGHELKASRTWPGAYFTKLGLTNPGYKPKPGYLKPCLYSLVYSVPLKPSEAQKGQIWRARIIKPRLQARARIHSKTHETERRFLDRDQSRRGQQSTRKKVPASRKPCLQLSLWVRNWQLSLWGSHGNNLKRGIRAALVLIALVERFWK